MRALLALTALSLLGYEAPSSTPRNSRTLIRVPVVDQAEPPIERNAFSARLEALAELRVGALDEALATGAAACDPEGGDTATAAGQIDHVIVVMMENRSFDHYLGALLLEEGRAVDGLTGGESNPDLSGVERPVYHLEIDCQADPPHGWSSSHDQFNDGANDGFAAEHHARVGEDLAGEVMGYYGREDLPIHYALADAYALPDAWFCSVMGPTWPNRLYGQAGTSGGSTGNDLPDGGSFTFKTVYEAVDEIGLDWGYYYTDIPFIGLFEDHWDASRIGFVEAFIEAGFSWKVEPVPVTERMIEDHRATKLQKRRERRQR